MPNLCQACEGSNNATDTLSSRGVRLTKLRRDVLQILHHSKQSVGAYELFDQLYSEGKASAPPAVYRVLNFLVAQGMAHKLSSVSGYTACCGDPTPHQAAFLICRECGKVSEFESPTPKSLSTNEFQVENVTLEASGLCKSCQ